MTVRIEQISIVASRYSFNSHPLVGQVDESWPTTCVERQIDRKAAIHHQHEGAAQKRQNNEAPHRACTARPTDEHGSLQRFQGNLSIIGLRTLH
jgi:glucan phosphorylase